MSRDERGAVSVLMLAVAGLALVLAFSVAAVGVVIGARRQAVAAADAAALAAAPVTFRPFGAGGTAAEEAAQFARANGSRLVRCLCPQDLSWEPRVVIVEVARTVPFPPFGTLTVTAIGRARFVPAALLGG